MAYIGLIPGFHPIKELKRSRVWELAPDVWEIEGYLSTNFLFKPPSSNCFILRDDKLVLLIDTGTYPYYREPILKILERYRKDGAKHLVLMLTQGHFDHVANNDIILEAGYDKAQFLLPEEEIETIDLYSHWMSDFDENSYYFDPYRAMPVKFPTVFVNLASRVSKKTARRMISANCQLLFRGVKTLAEQAVILRKDTRITRNIGDVEFQGWEIGRFFAILDSTHSPGHLSFYDPKYELLLTGDTTLEINPPFINGSINKCIDMIGKYKKIAEQGYIKLATDAHRSIITSEKLVEKYKRDPVDPIQAIDYAQGRDDCIRFYDFFEKYHRALKEETLKALSRLEEATVSEIVEEFKASNDPHAQFKAAAEFPELPSRIEVMVANVMKENKSKRRVEGDRILFSLSFPLYIDSQI